MDCSFLVVEFPPLERYDLLICVSLRAAEALAHQEQKTQLPIMAPGERTAAYLGSCGFVASCPRAGVGSEAILACSELEKIADKKILLIAGKQGRGLLKEELIKRGAQVDELTVYECRPCYYSLARWQEAAPLNLIWVTSERILMALRQNIVKNQLNWLYQVRLLVGSERLARLARALPFHQSAGLANTYNETLIDYLCGNELWQ